MDLDRNALLFERPWFPTVFRICKENGLDWLRVCACALLRSEGDPRARTVDWEFINDKLAIDNPIYAGDYEDGQPNIDLVDLGTRWGLFGIHGKSARDLGFTGKLVNLLDVTKNAQIFSSMYARAIAAADTGGASDPPRVAEEVLGILPVAVDDRVGELKRALSPMLEDFGETEHADDPCVGSGN